VAKVTGTATTTYVYDAQGNLAAEYSTAGNPQMGTLYLTVDQLGSTRLETQMVGTAPGVVSRSDYLPFGQEIPSTWNRSNYQPDPSQTLKFTGKERDAETGLDCFGARYLSAAQGRFISTDPTLSSAQPQNPQSWNRYAYVYNNPSRHIDPDGQAPLDLSNPEVQKLLQALRAPTGKTAGTFKGGLIQTVLQPCDRWSTGRALRVQS